MNQNEDRLQQMNTLAPFMDNFSHPTTLTNSKYKTCHAHRCTHWIINTQLHNSRIVGVVFATVHLYILIIFGINTALGYCTFAWQVCPSFQADGVSYIRASWTNHIEIEWRTCVWPHRLARMVFDSAKMLQSWSLQLQTNSEPTPGELPRTVRS